MASTIQVDKITDIGGNTMIESNGSGTFTNSLPAPTSGIAASAIDSGTIATARLGSGTASSSTFLRGDQTYATAGGENTPSFHVVKNGAQSVNNTTATAVTSWTETWDSDNTFASNKFTPGVAGKYFIYFSLVVDQLDNGTYIWTQIRKNGSLLLTCQQGAGATSSLTSMAAGQVDLGASDYIEFYCYHNSGAARNVASGTNPGTFAGGYKIIGA